MAALNNALLSDTDRQKLSEVLDKNNALQAVYQFEQRLQNIWQQQASNHEAKLEALRSWCNEAEASGIAALREFVSIVKSYRMVPLH